MPSNVKKSVSLTFLTSVASKNGKFLKNCNPNILPPSVLAKTCISAFKAHNLGFLSLMARGQVKNKILHYAGPNSELDRSPQAPADAQKCRFLTWTRKNTFFGIYQPKYQKNWICQENGIANVLEVSELAKTAVTMSGWESWCIDQPDPVPVVTN